MNMSCLYLPAIAKFAKYVDALMMKFSTSKRTWRCIKISLL
jgi:hypothetical protein